MTLTELALLLFFLVLLLSTFLLLRKDKELHRMGTVRSFLNSYLGSQGIDDPTDDHFRKLTETIAGISETEQRLHEQVSKNESLTADLGQCAEEQRDCEGQRRYMERRLQAQGLGFPPCWASAETGKVEYIYRVTIREDDLQVNRAWPAHREDDVDRIQGARALLAPSLDLLTFSELAAPLLAWSQTQEPECRLFVIIAGEGSPAYKRMRLRVEDFFYKWEAR